MRWASVVLVVLVVALVTPPPSVDAQIQNPLKFFKMYLKNTLTEEVFPCFPRDWSMDGIRTVSSVFDSYADRTGFLFGFDGPDDLEVHDCNGDDGISLDVGTWGCNVDLIRNANAEGQAIWQMKYDVGLCDEGLQTNLEPNTQFLVRFFEEREFIKREISAQNFNVEIVSETSGGSFRNMKRYVSNFSQSFGPPSFAATKLEINIFFLRNLGLDFELQANIPVRHYNDCNRAQLCLEGLYAGMNPPSWICPYPLCPPGYEIYKQDRCYLSLANNLVTTNGGQQYRMSQPVYNQTVLPMTGIRDCLDRGIDHTYCYSNAMEVLQNCVNYPSQDFAYTAP